MATLLDRAVAGGDARADVSARDVTVTAALLCQTAPGRTADFSRRMPSVFLAGPARPGSARLAK